MWELGLGVNVAVWTNNAGSRFVCDCQWVYWGAGGDEWSIKSVALADVNGDGWPDIILPAVDLTALDIPEQRGTQFYSILFLEYW